MDIWLYIYIWVSLVSTIALIGDGTPRDMFISVLAGIMWPIIIPSMILRKIIN